MHTCRGYKETPQAPISSSFGAQTTALEAVEGIDLNGKIAIVTGGHSGIGLETTRALAAAGATVIVAGHSKSANALFAVGLDKHGYADGIRAFSVHPGRIETELARFLTAQERPIGGEYKTTEQGAATSVWCATTLQLEGRGGVYCLDCDIAELMPNFSLQGMGQQLTVVLPCAVDQDMAEHLWIMSEEMTGVKFEG